MLSVASVCLFSFFVTFDCDLANDYITIHRKNERKKEVLKIYRYYTLISSEPIFYDQDETHQNICIRLSFLLYCHCNKKHFAIHKHIKSDGKKSRSNKLIKLNRKEQYDKLYYVYCIYADKKEEKQKNQNKTSCT